MEKINITNEREPKEKIYFKKPTLLAIDRRKENVYHCYDLDVAQKGKILILTNLL